VITIIAGRNSSIKLLGMITNAFIREKNLLFVITRIAAKDFNKKQV
jgi:hypothetical protein